jgi:hypothetical protein
MPTFAIVRLLTLALLMVGSAWLIARYRFIGLVVSIMAGWGILVFAYSTWPAPPVPYDFDEDREDMPMMGPLLMAIWCIPVWGIVELWSWNKRRGKQNA